MSLLVLLVFGTAAAPACRRGPSVAEDVRLDWMTLSLPEVQADTVGHITLGDAAGRPLRGAVLQVEALMAHPGMAPVAATVSESGDGVYRVRVRFTMAGDWILMVTGALPDGRTLNRRIDVAHVKP